MSLRDVIRNGLPYRPRSISPQKDKTKAQKRRKQALFTPKAVLAGGISVGFLKLPAEVVDGMKAAGKADLLQGETSLPQQPARGLQPVLDQGIDGGASQIGVKAAAGLAAADVGGLGQVRQRDGFGIVLVDVTEHFLQPDLAFQLDPRGVGFREGVKVTKEVLENVAHAALDRQLITWRGLIQETAGVLDELVHRPVGRGFVAEDDKGQAAALGNGLNVFLMYGAVFRRDDSAGKEENGEGIGTVAGQLPDSVQHVSVDKDAVPCLQGDMLLPDLVIQKRCTQRSRVQSRDANGRALPGWAAPPVRRDNS